MYESNDHRNAIIMQMIRSILEQVKDRTVAFVSIDTKPLEIVAITPGNKNRALFRLEAFINRNMLAFTLGARLVVAPRSPDEPRFSAGRSRQVGYLEVGACRQTSTCFEVP